MTDRERALVRVIETLPRDEHDPSDLDGLPIIGVLRGAQRLYDALHTPDRAGDARADLYHLVGFPDSVELPEQRRARTGVDWHVVLMAYINYPSTVLRSLAG